MKEMLENLWNNYFAEECAVINTKEERALAKKIVEMRDQITAEAAEALEQYVEALFESQGVFIKKAFFKGCEFTVSFLFGLGSED